MKTLLLLTLIGLATSAHPTTHLYRYAADVNTGVEPRYSLHQISGSRIEADVKVSLLDNNKGVVLKIMEPEVGNYNGMVKDRRSPPPIRLYPMANSSALQQEYVVYFAGSKERLIFPANDPLWVRNIKRAVASTLRIPFVLGKPVNVETPPFAFSGKEECLHGLCNVEYSIAPATKRAGFEYDSNKNTRGYRVVKSVDLDACSSEVGLTKASQGNFSDAITGNLQIQGRTSVGDFVIIGSEPPRERMSMAIARAVIEGHFIIQPYGLNTQKLISLSNQTLTLLSTSYGKLPMPSHLSSKADSWMYEILSPFSKAHDSPSWIKFTDDSVKIKCIDRSLSGYGSSPTERIRLQERMSRLMTLIVDQMVRINERSNYTDGTMDGLMLRNISMMVQAMRCMDFENLSTLFDENVTKNPYSYIRRQIMIDTLRSAGTSEAFEVLLNNIKSGHLSRPEIISIFSSVNVAAFDPTLIPKLMDFALNSGIDDPVVLSIVLVNVGTLVRRMCVSPADKRFIYEKAWFGATECTAEQYKTFLAALLLKYGGTQSHHMKAIFIQTIANIGSPVCLEVLSGIASDTTASKSLRVLAINGITKNHLQNTTYEEAEKTLLTIIESHHFEDDMRMIAVENLLSFSNNASTYQRLAYNTWREPSPLVARFIYSYLKAIATGGNPYFTHKVVIARFTLPVAKPFNVGRYDSQYLTLSDFSMKHNVGYGAEWINIGANSTHLPYITKAKLLGEFGGLKHNAFHISNLGRLNLNIYDTLKDIMKHKIIRSMQNRKELDQESRMELDKFYHLSLYKNIEAFIPMSIDTLEMLRSSIKEIVPTHPLGTRMQTWTHTNVTYLNALESKLFVPSNAGVPVVIEWYKPYLLFQQLNVSLKAKVQETIPFAAQSLTKLVTTTNVQMNIFVPWTNVTVGLHVDGETSVNLPVEVSGQVDSSNKYMNAINYEIKMAKSDRHAKQIPILSTSIQPKTITKTLPWMIPSNVNIEKPLGSYQPSSYHTNKLQILPPILANISVEVMANVELPLNISIPLNKISLTPLKAAQYLGGASIKPFSVSLLYTPQETLPQLALSGRLLYGNFSGLLSSTSNLLSSAPIARDLSVMDTTEQRARKIMRSPEPVEHMVSASIGLKNSNKYETVLLTGPLQKFPGEVPIKGFSVQTNFLKYSPETSSKQVCVKSSFQWPEEAARFLGRHPLPTQLESDVYSGHLCEDRHLTLKAIAKMSQKNQELHRQGQQSKEPIYDELTLQVEKNKSLGSYLEKLIKISPHYVLNPSFQDTLIQEGSPKLAQIKGTRSLNSGVLSIRADSPSGVSKLNSIRIPRYIDELSPIRSM